MTVPLFDLKSCVLAFIIVITVARLILFCYRTYQNAYKATIMSSKLTSHEVRQGGRSRCSPERKVAVSYDWGLGTESLRSELHYACKQMADLRDKFDDATCELAAENRKNKTSVNLDDATCELAAEKRKNKTSVNLDDDRHQHQEIQQQMSAIVAIKYRLSRSIKDMVSDSKETQEFLIQECNATMESLQEAENETENLQSMLNDNNEQCRQLLEELEQKDLYIQTLQDRLESTENRARDTLLGQGTEITGASLALSEEVRKLCKSNRIEKDTKHDGIVTNDDDVNNGNDVVHNNATSSVHSVLQAIKNSDNDNVGKYTDACGNDDINGQNFCDEICRFPTPFWPGSFTPLETIQEEDEGSNDRHATEESSDVIRPVGFTTPFRSISPLSPIQEEDSATDEPSNHGDGNASVLTLINSMYVMISNFAVISSRVQDQLKSQLKQLDSEKKHLGKQLQNERSNKTETIIELNNKITNFEMEISVLRGQKNISTSAKNKLKSICDGNDITMKEAIIGR